VRSWPTDANPEVVVDDKEPFPPGVEAFIEEVRALGDEDRQALAQARRAIDETVHVGARRAADEMVAERAGTYVEAWIRIGSAFIPERLKELAERGSDADRREVAGWQDVARLARAAIDDALLALLTLDTIPPPDIRELYGPWKAMLAAAYERTGQASPSVIVPPPTTSSPE
jgi:hypothetical protein